MSEEACYPGPLSFSLPRTQHPSPPKSGLYAVISPLRHEMIRITRNIDSPTPKCWRSTIIKNERVLITQTRCALIILIMMTSRLCLCFWSIHSSHLTTCRNLHLLKHINLVSLFHCFFEVDSSLLELSLLSTLNSDLLATIKRCKPLVSHFEHRPWFRFSSAIMTHEPS